MTSNEKQQFAARLNAALDCINAPAKYGGRQMWLAKLMGVSQNAARKWMEGESIPGMDNLIGLAKKTGVTAEWLATGRGQMQSENTADGNAPNRIADGSLDARGSYTENISVSPRKHLRRLIAEFDNIREFAETCRLTDDDIAEILDIDRQISRRIIEQVAACLDLPAWAFYSSAGPVAERRAADIKALQRAYDAADERARKLLTDLAELVNEYTRN